MPNRLDIELTSVRGDGSYTWRAAGARQPKGVIDAKVLADDAKVGDVLRVEAEVEIDGITILWCSAAEGEGGAFGTDRAARLLQAGSGSDDRAPLRRGPGRRPPRSPRQPTPWRSQRLARSPPGARRRAPGCSAPATGCRRTRSGRRAPTRTATASGQRAWKQVSSHR